MNNRGEENEMSISVQNITKSFKDRRNAKERKLILKDISFDVSEGEFVSLLGPSGCGKTTTLTIIAGFQSPDEGKIVVNGKEVSKPGPDRAFMFQNYALWPNMTVYQNIAFGLGNIKEELRAMACDPKVLLMDEPLGAVDFQMRQLLQMQLEQMLMQKKTTALMVTHDVDEAVYLSDRVIVMSRDYGRILTDLRIDLPRPRDRTHVMYHNYVDHLTNVLKSALNGDVKSDEDKDLLEFIQKSELEKNRLHNALFGDADKK